MRATPQGRDNARAVTAYAHRRRRQRSQTLETALTIVALTIWTVALPLSVLAA